MNIESVRKEWTNRVVDGSFTLLRWLGGSEAGVVFLTELRGDRPMKAAIKLIPADADEADSRFAGWLAARDLSHPHLARLFYSGRCRMDNREMIYAVTEYSDELLAEIVAERPLSPHEGREMLGPAVDALVYLHSKGLVHGRIKPSNIMVVNDQLKISGDSLYVMALPEKRSPALGPYDAPERAEREITPSSDVWSLGVTLIEAMTQLVPTWDRSAGTEPAANMPLLPPFAEIASECLRMDPANRCTLGEIKACLKSGTPIPKRSSIAETRSSGKARVMAIWAGALILIAVAGIYLVRSRSSKPVQPPPAVETSQTEPAADGGPTKSAAPEPAQTTTTTPATSPASAPASASATPAETHPALTTTVPPAPHATATPGSAVKGEVAQRALPDVSSAATGTIQGKVDVSVEVSVAADGSVENASFRSAGPSKYFSAKAIEAARKWKFTPPQANGHDVPSKWLLHFQFRASGIEVVPQEETP